MFLFFVLCVCVCRVCVCGGLYFLWNLVAAELVVLLLPIPTTSRVPLLPSIYFFLFLLLNLVLYHILSILSISARLRSNVASQVVTYLK